MKLSCLWLSFPWIPGLLLIYAKKYSWQNQRIKLLNSAQKYNSVIISCQKPLNLAFWVLTRVSSLSFNSNINVGRAKSESNMISSDKFIITEVVWSLVKIMLFRGKSFALIGTALFKFSCRIFEQARNAPRNLASQDARFEIDHGAIIVGRVNLRAELHSSPCNQRSFLVTQGFWIEKAEKKDGEESEKMKKEREKYKRQRVNGTNHRNSNCAHKSLSAFI